MIIKVFTDINVQNLPTSADKSFDEDWNSDGKNR